MLISLNLRSDGWAFWALVLAIPFVIVYRGAAMYEINHIILIDYIDILRKRDGMNRRKALVQGGKTRFRPVILTAATTALGLVPLAIGLNFDFFGLYGSLTPELYWGGEQASWWGSMAVAVIVGILFATFLTLILVPVLYSLVDDMSAFFRRHFVASEEVPVRVKSG